MESVFNGVVDVCKCGNTMDHSEFSRLDLYACKKKEFDYTESILNWTEKHLKLESDKS